ncbi:MAG: electron transfer flavoprotein subunit beta/FixA family protein [Bacteroidales bacterium]|jgi:electron transfer flavoprotein beta subunit|nr:electron transfer flavoprotein subunit beta/FixA family protein [Bacteroidales bacterium]
MSLKIVVLAKQVPDTRNVGKDAMKEDGTVNRSVLPAIFNPDDLNALEMALQIKSQSEGATLTVITMGPMRAADIIKEALFRGADNGFLLTDSKFAGSDTLATSYALSKAVAKCEPDIIFCGVQAIDGDTAQVGPQIAEKLNIPQITYAEEIINFDNNTIQIKRRLEHGTEIVETKLPVLISVHSSAKPCRSRHAKLLMRFKHAATKSQLATLKPEFQALHTQNPQLTIGEWNVNDVQADVERLGLGGSPTKVKKIDSVVLTQKESKKFTSCDGDIEQMVTELMESKVIG